MVQLQFTAYYSYLFICMGLIHLIKTILLLILINLLHSGLCFRTADINFVIFTPS